MFQGSLALKNAFGLDRTEDVNHSVTAADNFSRLISALRRHTTLIIAVCLAGVSIGTLYITRTTPLYKAAAQVIIDNRQVRAIRDVSTLDDGPLEMAGVVDSQVEVLRSEEVGLAVVKTLNLTEDRAFVDPPRSWLRNIWNSVVGPLVATLRRPQPIKPHDPTLNRQKVALATLNDYLRVRRVGASFVVEIAYTWPEPARAAEIANAYTNAYMLKQLTSGIEATRRAGDWLQERAEELRQLSVEADLAAQKFKADNNLLSAKGMLIAEQQLNEMTSELIKARASTAQARARYERIKEIVDNRQTEAAVTESIDNPVINALRTKYLDSVSRLNAFEAMKLGVDHGTVTRLKKAVDSLHVLLFEELGRIAESFRSDYEVASAREIASGEQMAQQRNITIAANESQAQLHQLEQKAESYRSLYQSYMQRYQESAQHASYPMTDARVVSVATPPLRPSHPHIPLVMGISLVLGTLVGTGIALLRELSDDAFRTVEQVHDELGVGVLGMVPFVAAASQRGRAQDATDPALRFVSEHPFSEFAETLRSAKAAADHALPDRSLKIVGVVSFLPDEGKTTIAKNFASLLSLQGAKTLVVDADTRNPKLTRSIGRESGSEPKPDPSAPLSELLVDEPESGLEILPCVYAAQDRRVPDGLSPAVLQALVKGSDRSFDYVVIDLPPIGPSVSARVLAPEIDAFIFVVAWGKTSRGAIRAALAQEHSIRSKLLGVILNKVDLKKIKTYEHYRSAGYYRKQYEQYFKHTERDGCSSPRS
jgi:succinoglycan biosynthesis transport protein ExoP